MFWLKTFCPFLVNNKMKLVIRIPQCKPISAHYSHIFVNLAITSFYSMAINLPSLQFKTTKENALLLILLRRL